MFLYTAKLEGRGSFLLPSFPKGANLGEPYLVLGVKDNRGIKKFVLQWQKKNVEIVPGTRSRIWDMGAHAFVELSSSKRMYSFQFTLQLQGMEKFSMIPAGKQTNVSLSSTWSSPSFMGRYLPEKRVINKKGFKATWNVSSLASNFPQQLQSCSKGACSGLMSNFFGLSFLETIDIYQQTERSLKYGLLFIGLTFLFFLMFEVLKQLRIHPVQYTLIGFALILFYLLLLSLSEHFSFFASYLIASSVCIGLLGFYVRFVLKSLAHSAFFSGSLVVLYSCLYILLQQEGAALLLGSGMLFALLACLMFFTRKVDWYSLLHPEMHPDDEAEAQHVS